MSMLVPFGQYRGQPVEAMLADTSYTLWYLNTPDLHERFPQFHQVVSRLTVELCEQIEQERSEYQRRVEETRQQQIQREKREAKAKIEGTQFAYRFISLLALHPNAQEPLTNENYAGFRDLFPQHRRGPITQMFINTASKAKAKNQAEFITAFYHQRFYDWHGQTDAEVQDILSQMMAQPIKAKLFIEYILMREAMSIPEREAMSDLRSQ